ncbi:hypothetical protein [Pseudomonas uvaldensis]|uniref:hypothetical protein n=1 Tax=Pseudomonas uvaldensis TaxID=2878385 RepID=UPI001E654D75|nr:hypothetical protein [Pseudomonas uvaldensis]MCE0464880.1 hypothetical protein [Pseudomonas uvaldensis]
MRLDKTKLQKLLWAEAASFRADCADWKRNTEALQEFLGEKTLEEVALELLAENETIKSQFDECARLFVDATELACKAQRERDQFKADNETWRLSIEAERCVHRATVKGLQDELDRLKGPAFDAELAAMRRDAERWRALISCARIRFLGSAGYWEKDPYGNSPGNYRHFGAEFWTMHEAPTADKERAAEILNGFADAAIAAMGQGGQS